MTPSKSKDAEMVAQRCTRCGKRILGYSKRHVAYMLSQHVLAKHTPKDNEERTNERKVPLK